MKTNLILILNLLQFNLKKPILAKRGAVSQRSKPRQKRRMRVSQTLPQNRPTRNQSHPRKSQLVGLLNKNWRSTLILKKILRRLRRRKMRRAKRLRKKRTRRWPMNNRSKGLGDRPKRMLIRLKWRRSAKSQSFKTLNPSIHSSLLFTKRSRNTNSKTQYMLKKRNMRLQTVSTRPISTSHLSKSSSTLTMLPRNWTHVTLPHRST